VQMVVGLGNPGKEYERTRHNIGFRVLDHLSFAHDLVFRGSRWRADVARGDLWGRDMLLVKPMTFMNRSGEAVGAICRFYDLRPEEVVVVHDDLDLPFARVKVARGRGAGGHNGVKSLIDHLGSRDFIRVRIGIGRPPQGVEPSNYVLSPFAKSEEEKIVEVLEHAVEALRLTATEGVQMAMNAINQQPQAPGSAGT